MSGCWRRRTLSSWSEGDLQPVFSASGAIRGSGTTTGGTTIYAARNGGATDLELTVKSMAEREAANPFLSNSKINTLATNG
jgi:hypothetical protein